MPKPPPVPEESKFRVLEWAYEHQGGDTDIDYYTPVFEYDVMLYHLEVRFENFVGSPLVRIMLHSSGSYVTLHEQKVRSRSDHWIYPLDFPLPIGQGMSFRFYVSGGITGAIILVTALVHAL